jgi:hypothetical protein
MRALMDYTLGSLIVLGLLLKMTLEERTRRMCILR